MSVKLSSKSTKVKEIVEKFMRRRAQHWLVDFKFLENFMTFEAQLW